MLIIKGIWKIIRGWLDPVVASKIHFTKNIEELEQFVEKSHIPKELGGDDPWTYRYVEPIPGEDRLLSDKFTRQQMLAERADTIRDYEATTQQWIRDPKLEGVLQQRRSELTERLRSGYWDLDPYLRARTLYDRTGMLREGGKVLYYEVPATAAKLSATPGSTPNGPLPAEQRADDLD